MSFLGATKPAVVFERKVGELSIMRAADRLFAIRKRESVPVYEVFASNEQDELVGPSLIAAPSYPSAIKALAGELTAGAI